MHVKEHISSANIVSATKRKRYLSTSFTTVNALSIDSTVLEIRVSFGQVQLVPPYKNNFGGIMNSYEFRTNPRFLRNEFISQGRYGFAKVQKQNLDLSNIQLLACTDTKSKEADRYKSYGVHFFVDDYRFDGIYNNPEKTIERYSQYAFLLSPDFSLYQEMPLWRQIESVSKNRWVAAFWQSQGLTVIPTISWSGARSYEFCFDSVEKHSIVAIGMIGCKHSKHSFLCGYEAMINKIEPSAVICFGTPFKEMNGNIITIDYVSSRKKVR